MLLTVLQKVFQNDLPNKTQNDFSRGTIPVPPGNGKLLSFFGSNHMRLMGHQSQFFIDAIAKRVDQ